MRKFLVSVLFVITICACANADVLYLTDSGQLGRIRTFRANSADLYGTQYSSSWSSPLLGSYWTGSTTRVILIDRNTDRTTSGDTALIFDPADLTQPIDSTRKVLDGVYSAQAMAGSDNGRSVFFVSGASIREYSTGDFSLRRSYTYSPKTSEDITAKITGMITGTDVIYALVEQDISRDILLVFDGQLREDVKSFQNIPLPAKAEAISWLSSSRVAIGNEYGVDVWYNNTGWHLVSTDAEVKTVCQDSGGGFYFIEQSVSEADGTYTTTLRHYKSETEISTLFTNTEGQAYRLVRDKDNGIVAAIVGDEILVYAMDKDTLLGEYDSYELGSMPVQITISNVSGDDGSTKSGCSISGIGAVMILLAGMSVMLKRH